MKLGRACWTAWIAAALLSAFETLWVVVAERGQPVGYFFLTMALCFASASLIALVFSLLTDPPRWVAVALAAAGAALAWGAASALAVGLCLSVVLGLRKPARHDSSTYGIAVAVGLGGAAIIAPRLLTRIAFADDAPESVLNALLTALSIFVITSVVVLCQRFRETRWLPLAISLTFLGFVGLPLLSRSSEADSDVVDFAEAPPFVAVSALEHPHILLIVLDTLRADHLTLYGYERPTTPNLEAFMRSRPGAAVFPSIYANSNWTVPSHASLFTGLMPSDHGAHFGSGSSLEFSIGEHPTLAERMRDAGYRSIGIYANPWLGIVEGLDRGFDVYRSPRVSTRLPLFGESLRRLWVPGVYPGVIHDSPRADIIGEAIESELLECGDQACFVFANFVDAHSFYVAENCRGRFADWSLRENITILSIHDPPERTAHLMARYDEGICELDRVLGGLLQRLATAGILDKTWVMMTSDHGEAFGEHESTEHGSSVYNEQIWIPLLVIPPIGSSIEAGREPGSLVDVAATVIAIGGAEPLGIGRDLRQPAGPDASAASEFFGDATKQATQNPRAADPARAVIMDSHKLVDQSGRLELFDLRTDAHERQDRAADQPERVSLLRKRLPVLRFSQATAPTDSELSREVIEQLRELGYGR